MPFGFMNAHVVFQHMANDIFRDFLDKFTIVYLDDILIYSKTQKDHERHVLKSYIDWGNMGSMPSLRNVPLMKTMSNV